MTRPKQITLLQSGVNLQSAQLCVAQLLVSFGTVSLKIDQIMYIPLSVLGIQVPILKCGSLREDEIINECDTITKINVSTTKPYDKRNDS